MFKQQFLLSVNENFGLHTKNILEPEIYRYKNNNISNQKANNPQLAVCRGRKVCRGQSH